MTYPLRALVLLSLILVGTSAHATLQIIEPWVRPAAATHSTEAYMQLVSSEGINVVDLRCADAATVRLVGAEGRNVAPMALPAGTTVSLAPGRTRAVLGKLSRTLHVGDRVPCTLFLRAGDGAALEIAIDAEVRRRSPREDHHTH